MDNVFDSAFNLTQVAGDLPNVRWGRIDYLNVTAITTRWSVWKYVFLSSLSLPYPNLFLERLISSSLRTGAKLSDSMVPTKFVSETMLFANSSKSKDGDIPSPGQPPLLLVARSAYIFNFSHVSNPSFNIYT